MQSIFIKNFKSYKETRIQNFNHHINVILGKNGQGKSNFFKALSFALSDRSSLNQTQLANNLHRGLDHNKDSNIEVQIHMLKNSSDPEQLYQQSDAIHISKIWTQQPKQQLYLDHKSLSKKQYENTIETSFSLSYSNPYNMIHQGKIHQIILMDEFQLYKLLEEITGVKKFHKRKQQALTTMKKVQSQKKQIEIMMDDLSRKLQVLESRKQQFQYFVAEQKTKKFRMHKHYAEMLEGTKYNLSKIRSEFSDALLALSKIQQKKENCKQEAQKNAIYIATAKQKLINISKDYENRFKSQITQGSQIGSQQLSRYKKQLQSIQKQLLNNDKKLAKKDKDLQQFKSQYAQIEKKYDKLKLSTHLSSANKENKNKFFKAYEQQIQADESRVIELEKEQQKKYKQIQTRKKQLNSNSDKNQQILEDYQYLQSKGNELKRQINQNQMELKGLLLHSKNKAQLDVQTLSEYVKVQHSKMRKILPFLDISLMEVIRKQNIKGVYGYFINYVKIDEAVTFAYEIAGLNKLCSLLVQDETACSEVIKLNKKIKGKQINIIQMSYFRNQTVEKKVFPKNDRAKKLTNSKWIKTAKPSDSIQYPQSFEKDLEKLINLAFNNYALVSDYETALNISKQYYLNCITAEKQIIYAEGYLCKVGKDQYTRDNNKIDTYYKFMEKKNLLDDKKQIRNNLIEKQEYLEKKERELLQQQQKIKSQYAKIQNRVNEINQFKTIENILNKELQNIIKMKDNTIKSLANKKQYLKSFQNSKNKEKQLSQGEIQKIQNQYNKKTKTLNKLLTQTYEIQQKLEQLTNRKEQLIKIIAEQEENQNNNGLKNQNFEESIENVLKQKQKHLIQIQKELQELDENQRIIFNQKSSLQIKLSTYQEQQRDLLNKIQQIGEITEEMEQQMEEISNSMSLSASKGPGTRKKHHFSTKDKLMFEKYSGIIQNFKEYKITYQELVSAQQKIRQFINQYENQADSYISKIAEQFQKQFQDIFSRIVENGSSEVRFKKVSEKIKENAYRYRSCMIIRVSFTNQQGQTLKKWHQFSGGQKTIIAIAIILALQRCQPAPFYVLDEIDAALDSMYVTKIIKIIAEQSIKKNTQYFITSFKEQMLNFSTAIANYYLVNCENRVSNIKQISQKQAKQALKFITMQN